MANAGNNPAYEEDIVAEEGHSEDQEIQVDDTSEGNNIEREYNGRPAQPPPPPRAQQPAPRGYDPPAITPRRSFVSMIGCLSVDDFAMRTEV